MILVDIYCRVSTQEQVEGYSLGEQEKSLRKYADAHGWTVNRVCIDGGYSGSNLDRPGIQQIIADASTKAVNKVLVYKLDRLSRSQRDTLYLIEDIFIKNGVDFVSFSETLDTGSPFGIAVIGVLSVFSQLERSTISSRMMMGRDASVKSGNFRGGGNTPVGFHYDPQTKELTADEYEAMVLNTIFRLYIDGVTASRIAVMLNKEYKFRHCQWNGEKIIKLLKQPLYTGMQRWKGELIRVNNCPIIIDDVTWQTAQTEVARRTSKAPKAQSPHRHTTLLGGLLWCGCCGHRYAGCSDKGAGGKKIYRYYCYQRLRFRHSLSKENCENRSWRSDELDKAILSQIEQLQIAGDINSAGTVKSAVSAEIDALQARIEELDKQQERVIELFSIGALDASMVTIRADKIREEKNALVEQLEKLKNPIGALKSNEAIDALTTFRQLVAQASKDNGYMELYDVVHQLIQSITLTGDDVRIVWNFE